MIYSDELCHHGIKGQRWGIRRFENKDGTLTPEGKSRYSKRQQKEDERLYGKRAAKRIRERVDRGGEGVKSARHAEVKRQRRKQILKRTARIAATIAAPIAIAKINTAMYNRSANRSANRYKNTHPELLGDFLNNKILNKPSSHDSFDLKRRKSKLENILNRTPEQAKEEQKRRQSAIDSINKLMRNTEKRDQDIQKKMKEYWDKKGRRDWERKNKGK